jgi:hypothetical protein
MQRLELAISGVEQALRPAAGFPVQLVRQHLPGLVEALGAEQTEVGDQTSAARARRLARERNRLLRQLRALTPELPEGCLVDDAQAEELRRALLRLLHDIAHHHQRVNDLVYDGAWRDVGGSE